jgi:mono/diheme cytochrome c family protein
LLLAACGRGPGPCVEPSETTSSDVAPASDAAAAAPPGDPVEGARVARRVGCDGCHGEGGRGEKLWGEPGRFQVHSPNLTVKRNLYDDAGLGALLREGRTHDGHRPLGMPVFMFQDLSEREVRDIVAWVRSLPEVDNPDAQASWYGEEIQQQLRDGTYPYDDDRPRPGIVAPAVPPTDALALGRHIAYTSCTECHGEQLEGWGGDDPTPSLVAVAKAYTPETFSRLMRTGIAANGKDTATMMSGVARWRFSTLTDEEIAALKLYLDSR